MSRIIKLLKNLKFLISYCIAYVIVHGWSYVFVAIGYIFDINWMFNVGISWLTILWLPNGVVFATTIPPAILIHWILFKEKIKLEDDKRKEKVILKRCQK